MWTTGGNTVQNDCRHCITGGVLTGTDVSYDKRVESVLSILNITLEDAGEYTCSIMGNNSEVNLNVLSGKII